MTMTATMPSDGAPPASKRKRRTQAERSAEARALLVDVAIREIGERGLAYVTMAEIADQSGMTRGAIQHHFGGRDDFMRAVLEAITDRVAARLAQQPPAGRAAPDRLIAECVRALGRIVLSPEQLAVTDISISSRSESLLLKDGRRTSERMLAIYGAAWERWLDGAYPPAPIVKGFDIFRMFCSGILVINYGDLDSSEHEDALALCAELITSAIGPSRKDAKE